MPELELIGQLECSRNLRRIADATPGELKRALRNEARIELNEAIRRTPRKTGDLRDSAHLSDPEVDGRDISIQLIFSMWYAVYVHEDLEADHPIGQAKFLESTLLESAPYMLDRFARRIDLNRL